VEFIVKPTKWQFIITTWKVFFRQQGGLLALIKTLVLYPTLFFAGALSMALIEMLWVGEFKFLWPVSICLVVLAGVIYSIDDATRMKGSAFLYRVYLTIKHMYYWQDELENEDHVITVAEQKVSIQYADMPNYQIEPVEIHFDKLTDIEVFNEQIVFVTNDFQTKQELLTTFFGLFYIKREDIDDDKYSQLTVLLPN